jgi:hypothetical protein
MVFEQGFKFRAQSIAALGCERVKREKRQHDRTPVNEGQASPTPMTELTTGRPQDTRDSSAPFFVRRPRLLCDRMDTIWQWLGADTPILAA